MPEFVAVIVVHAQEFDGERAGGIAHASEKFLVRRKTIIKATLRVATERLQRRGRYFLIDHRKELRSKILLVRRVESTVPGSGLEILSGNRIIFILGG